MPSRRTRSSSLNSEVMNEDYSTNERSSNSRTSRTSYAGETNYYIDCSDPAPTGYVNERIVVYYYLVDDNGQRAELSDGCSAVCSDQSVEISWIRQRDYFQVELYTTYVGYYQFRVTVKAASGPSRTNNYYYNVVADNEDPNGYFVERLTNIDIYYSTNYAFEFRIVNKYNWLARMLDTSHPYDIISISSSIQIESFEICNNQTTLRIWINAINNTSVDGDRFTLVIYDNEKNSFDTWVDYVVKPNAHISVEGIDNLLIDYGETVTYTFKLYNGMDGSKMYISKEGYELISDDYLMEFDYIDASKIRVKVTNNKNVDEGWFNIRLVSEEGFTYESSFVAVTNDRYMNYYWMQFNGEYFVYNESSYFIVTLFNRHGDNKLIKDMTVTSTNGIIPNATIKDINDYSYEYRFVPTRRGVEVFTIELVCADGSIYTSGFEVNIL